MFVLYLLPRHFFFETLNFGAVAMEVTEKVVEMASKVVVVVVSVENY